jgi:hypothetical protein
MRSPSLRRQPSVEGHSCLDIRRFPGSSARGYLVTTSPMKTARALRVENHGQLVTPSGEAQAASVAGRRGRLSLASSPPRSPAPPLRLGDPSTSLLRADSGREPAMRSAARLARLGRERAGAALASAGAALGRLGRLGGRLWPGGLAFPTFAGPRRYGGPLR